MENLRNRIDVKLLSNKKDYLKWPSKPSYMSQKIFDNDLVTIRKEKVTLTHNKQAYVGTYSAFACSKLTIETLERDVKYV